MNNVNNIAQNGIKYNMFSGKMHAVPCNLKGQYVIRFTLTSPKTTVQVLSHSLSFSLHSFFLSFSIYIQRISLSYLFHSLLIFPFIFLLLPFHFPSIFRSFPIISLHFPFISNYFPFISFSSHSISF